MTFKDFNLNISYKNVGEDKFSDILNPLLSCTKYYKRCVGFFSSSALNFIGDGIANLARNGGQISIATSPKLSEEDITAIQSGYNLRDILQNNFLKEFEEAIYHLSDKNAEILRDLIAANILDIKIVSKSKGMYHDKLAVLEDFDDNKVAFVGSSNETGAGYDTNYEKVRVFKGWIDPEGRVEDETAEFESIWKNEESELEVFSFASAIEQKIIERIEHPKNTSLASVENDNFKIRDYQEEAIKNWNNNGHKGFFVMATGTGKTITSLLTIKDFITNNSIFTVIAVPYKHLVVQWEEDAKRFIPNARVICVHGEISDAESTILSFYNESKKEYRPIIVITTINSFFIDRYKSTYSLINYDKLLIVDEAHNFYNSMSPELSIAYPYRLGLSATPVFGNDEEKTKQLLDWFGGKVIDYPIEKAIKEKYLVEYEYHPLFVEATAHDEDEFNRYTSIMLSAIDSRTNCIVDKDKFVAGYKGRLKTISISENKLKNISVLFSNIRDTDHTIIYCSDGRVVFGDENEEMRHLEFILKNINQSIITKPGSHLKATKFTATENIETRINIVDDFNRGNVNYLVAIRCLDEGINIPSIKSALLLSSNDSFREFVQRRGRILRLYSDPITNVKKELANIYDVIVEPSIDNKPWIKIELRRFYEYARLAHNSKELMNILDKLLNKYELKIEDIKFDNEYAYGGELDE